MLFLPVTAVQHVGATYSVGRRSAVLPRRRMTGPRGLRIFLTSTLLSSENRLTRLKPKANRTFRNNAGSDAMAIWLGHLPVMLCRAV